jgi:CRP-like cAMP-binding protein
MALFFHRRRQLKLLSKDNTTPSSAVAGGGRRSVTTIEGTSDEDLWAALHQFRMTGTGEDDGEREEPPPSPPTVVYHRHRRAPVSGVSTNLDESKNFIIQYMPKSEEDTFFLLGVMKKCPLFHHWEDAELATVIGAMHLRTYHKGECITRQGSAADSDTDAEGHAFYAIVQGHVSAIVDNMVLKVLRRGMFFGESNVMFLHSSTPITHRVDDAACVCYVLHSDVYRHITTGTAVNKRELYEGFLDRVPWLSGLTHREKLTLADALQPVVYEPGELLIEFGTRGEYMYIILSGDVDVFGRDAQGEVIPVCDFSSGDCVGELEFINNHMTVADVRARGRVKAARLSRDHFEMTMGPIVDVLKRAAQNGGKYSYYQGVMAQIS